MPPQSYLVVELTSDGLMNQFYFPDISWAEVVEAREKLARAWKEAKPKFYVSTMSLSPAMVRPLIELQNLTVSPQVIKLMSEETMHSFMFKMALSLPTTHIRFVGYLGPDKDLQTMTVKCPAYLLED